MVIGVIPSRLASVRLPNKPILDICGKPMIQWVYENASKASKLDRLVVATPDDEIFRCVEGFGGDAVMTASDHKTGTDRIAEAARDTDAGIIVNIQGDEPLIDPSSIDSLVEVLIESPDTPMASLMYRITDAFDFENPAVVKVVTDLQGFALYFSRAGIPYPRVEGAAEPMRHIGIYAYRRDFLLKYSSLTQTPLEKAESLEQLRVLEHGYKIRMAVTDSAPAGVDTPEDLEMVRRVFNERW